MRLSQAARPAQAAQSITMYIHWYSGYLRHGPVLYLASSTIVHCVPPRNFPLLRDTGASVTSHSAVLTPCRFTQGFNGGMVCMFQLPRCSLGATRPRSSLIAMSGDSRHFLSVSWPNHMPRKRADTRASQ